MKDFCQDEAPAIFQTASVIDCVPTAGAHPAGSVYTLSLKADKRSVPAAGQFFMLRSAKSQLLLARPISVFSVEILPNPNKIRIEFLILLKGQGTQELCSLKKGDQVELLGPCGNTFPAPTKTRTFAWLAATLESRPSRASRQAFWTTAMIFTRALKAALTACKT